MLSTNYGRIYGEQIDGSYPRRCSRCRKAPCPRHGGKIPDPNGHKYVSYAKPELDKCWLPAERKADAWRDEKGWHGYVGDPAITV